MALEVEVPESPSLRGPQSRGEYDAVDVGDEEVTDDYRRAEVRTALRAGAWRDGFEEWAETTYLTTEEFETVRDLRLFEEFDFYWVPASGDVGYRAPTVPDDNRDRFPDGGANGVDEELDGLGRTVSAVLESEAYLGGDELSFEFFAEDEDREAERQEAAHDAELEAEADAEADAEANEANEEPMP
ncbi:hypothetical protein [Halobaculum limi]|uniref:hypothetical protein n=1 Tax=Halobaculum limi TaxID=3031916 RepID=UPI0024060443|nr:hypothetical protein [Halobaculum sp. YSMS11]